jgi:hypothetical protein
MPYKILSLDGGGSWALLETLALGTLYGFNTPGQQILNRFDLVAANSGGSIVLAGLAVNFTPQKIVDLLNDETKRKLIFVKNFLSFTGLERYDAAAKLTGLRTLLAPGGDQFLNNLGLTCKVLIASFDYNRLRAQFFRSDTNSPAAGIPGTAQPTLAEAVHAATNAPIKYFDAPAQFATPAFAGYRYWDGAMGGFNNPTMAAVTEALSYGTQPGDIRILSLGTANVFLPMPTPLPPPGAGGQNPLCAQIDNSSVFHDLQLAATTILDDPPDQASFQAHLITSGASALSQNPAKPVTTGNIVRLNPWIQPVKTAAGWAVPKLLAYAPAGSSVPNNYPTDNEAFAALVALDIDAVEQGDVDLIATLGNAWLADAVPNQSIRATAALEPLIGHGTFSAGRAQAQTLGL